MEDRYPIDASAKDIPLETEHRLSRQEQRVLDALLEALDTREDGCVSNTELAEISLKYFTKISTLRSLGHDIVLVSEDSATGVAWYRLSGRRPRLKTYRVPVEVRVPGHTPEQCVFTVRAVSPLSARYRAWRAVKVIALEQPTEVVAPPQVRVDAIPRVVVPVPPGKLF